MKIVQEAWAASPKTIIQFFSINPKSTRAHTSEFAAAFAIGVAKFDVHREPLQEKDKYSQKVTIGDQKTVYSSPVKHPPTGLPLAEYAVYLKKDESCLQMLIYAPDMRGIQRGIKTIIHTFNFLDDGR